MSVLGWAWDNRGYILVDIKYTDINFLIVL